MTADERGRARRLQILQILALVIPTIAIVAAAVVMANRVAVTDREQDELKGFERQLVETRHMVQVLSGEYWTRRAEGGGIALPADMRVRFVEAAAAVERMAAERPGGPGEQAAIARVRRGVATLASVVTIPEDAITSANADRISATAKAGVLQLTTGYSDWIAAVERVADERRSDQDSLTTALFIVLGALVALLVGAATVMWVVVDRKRRAALGRIAAERDATDVVMESVQDALAVLDEDGVVVRANWRLAEMLGADATGLVGRPPTWTAHVPPGFTGEMDVTLPGDAGNREVALSVSRLRSDRGWLHVLRDVTVRRRAEAQMRAMAAEREVLRRVATFVASGAEPPEVYRLVAREAAQLVGADAAVVTRFEPTSERTIDVGVWVDPAVGLERPPGRVPLGGGAPTAVVFRSGEPVRVDDFDEMDVTSGQLFASRGYRSGAAAPVQVGQDRWGAVAVLSARRSAFPSGTETRLTRFAELVGLTVANAEVRQRLANQAATDPLTGLANHRSFFERLEAEVARARHDQTDLALVMIDLDRFKDVTDTFGHQTGDGVLAEVARRLAGEARTNETVARVGGEKFAWILPAIDGMNAWRAAERVRRSVAEQPFSGGVGHLTASAGVADLSQATDAANLVRLADGALYWAKASGRDVTLRYSPEIVRELSASERAERLAREQAVTALRALARAVDAKDPTTARHSERVAAMAVRLGDELGWDGQRRRMLEEAALLHDVGKIGVPDAILFKPDRLTDAERSEVESHAALGAEIVSDVLSAEQGEWIRGHHERWDGRGYPDRRGGEDIPLAARIIAVADAWDAMTSIRTYGIPRSPAAALDEVRRNAGTQFCPAVAGALERIWTSGVAGMDLAVGAGD